MQGKAIVFSAENKVDISSFDLRNPQQGEVLIQAEYSCLSPGTELRCLINLCFSVDAVTDRKCRSCKGGEYPKNDTL